MKFKSILLTSATLLLLAACDGANEAEISEQMGESSLENEVSNVQVEEQDDTLTSSSEEFYRSVVPYELSPARGLSSANLVSSYNVEEFEKGLFSISQSVFPTNEYIFREGQIISEEMIRGYLSRQYTSEELEEMDESELLGSDAFSNLGLNPSTQGETDPEVIAEEAPLYLSHILEQNYMKEDEEGNLSFDGITIGLAMNSVHYYQTEQYGQTKERALDPKTVKEEGQKMAAEILKRIRANDKYVDKEIVFAIFIQSADTDIVPGNFVSQAVVAPGENTIESFSDIDVQNILLPSREAAEISEETNSEYQNFNRDLASYFDSFTTSVGRGKFRDGTLESLTVEIPIEYNSRGEMIGMSQFVRDLVNEHFTGTDIEVEIKDKSQVYSVITRKGEGEANLYIFE
ncbi:CamS sex pheromone cAM373 precursor [Jeotgalicoccus saudimassiliensis]|uniref:CamS sex pheromone cAM373 n=1 Tax=Jeotgalicoccus saudimassiliensis TaxID=1461582 RepID=A0A078MGN9_9STAP|nr:CamS family sex pheromone protein [Jeotgalicoccus saudimassiliensis]CEA03826.1 CamS sex pheromone cAM373 precursor [Jeotgalicoccus saudimassiliensis]